MAITKTQTPYEFMARWSDAGVLTGAHVVFREAIIEAGVEISSDIGDALPVSLAGGAGFPIAQILSALNTSAIIDSEAKAAEIATLTAEKDKAKTDADALVTVANADRDKALAQVATLTAQLAALQPPVDATGVPQVITMVQAQLALLGAGLLDRVNAALAAIPGDQGKAAMIEWTNSANVHRTNALVGAMQASLGMTDAQIDALFIAAAKL